MTDPLLSIVSPVFTVAGQLDRDLGRDCVRLDVEESTAGLKTLRAQLVAVGAGAPGPESRMLYLDGVHLDFGMTIAVSIGPESGLRTVFEGTISGLELVLGDSEPPRLVIYAEDVLMKLRMTRRMHTYTKVTDADLVQQIATAHGLQTELTADGPRYEVVQQANQSDLAFLRQRARMIQAELWATGQTLHLSTRPRRRGTALTLVQGNELVTVRVLADLSHQRSEVIVTGYDAKTTKVINAKAASDIVTAETSTGRTGPDIVQRALGPSVSLRVRDGALNATEATAWAQAEMLRRSRRFVTVTGTTRGSPDMVVGSILTLDQIGPPFSGGGYYVTRCHHTFDLAQGMRTHFEAERGTVNGVA